MDARDRISRSRSPRHHDHKRRRVKPRSRSPRREHHPDPAPRVLPLNASHLSKQDLKGYRPMFGLYLDIQKQIDIDELEESEVRGRWKSFMNKWNRGELAEGWYDPETLQKAIRADALPPREETRPAQNSEDEDEYGPSLPTSMHRSAHNSGSASKAGPSIPTTSDVIARREQTLEDQTLARQHAGESLYQERRADRALQASRLDDLTPRADAGTRERQLEKKRLANESNRGFAQAAQEGGDVDLRDADVMGDDGGGEFKRMKQAQERKKNEREIRREEILRARRAERDEKLKGMREKEERTMGMLRDIARARFGAE